MFRRFLPALLLLFLSPFAQAVASEDPSETRLPVLLVAEESDPVEGSRNAQSVARRVVQGAADRLRSTGFTVREGKDGAFAVLPRPVDVQDALYRDQAERALDPGRVLTLSVAFQESHIGEAAGTETRFGGTGDEAWRLAAEVHGHLLRGMGDVLGYRSFDRGIVEADEGGSLPGSPAGLANGDAWVSAYPLFATNPAERAMLEQPFTLDLLSAALADAVSGYLNPAVPTPQRDAASGWRRFAPWRPVEPRLVVEAEGTTRVALTFDAGSYPPLEPSILDTLREAGVRCTMFLVGDFVDQHMDLVKQMVLDGHEISNHSDTHPDMPSISSAEIVSELDAFEEKSVALTGRSSRPWFRPPSGSYDDRVVRVAAQQGYYTIYWSADSGDWRPELSAATVKERLLRNATPGSILVAHLTSTQTAEVLPEVLRILKERGVEFATLSEILGPLD